MTRTPLPGGGWADAAAIKSGLLDEAPEPAPALVPEPGPPGMEYLQVKRLTRCGCPRHVAGTVVVLCHREGCEVRHPGLAAHPPPAPRPAPGAIPCPKCGNVAFALVDGKRRCDGAHGCGHIWSIKPAGDRPAQPRPRVAA